MRAVQQDAADVGAVSGRYTAMYRGAVDTLRALAEGRVLVSTPCDLLPMITANPADIPWVPPSFPDGRERYSKRFKAVEKYLAASS
jgi:hypothetical protein